jgi:hypothetical protein
MLGLPAGCHRSAASTESQPSELRDGLLWVAAATLQPTASLDRVFLLGVAAVLQQPAEAAC